MHMYPHTTIPCCRRDPAVTEAALQVARETPAGLSDPVVQTILEVDLVIIWTRILAQPATYVMSRTEFGVFNFFQHLFVGLPEARAARKRYWDSHQV